MSEIKEIEKCPFCEEDNERVKISKEIIEDNPLTATDALNGSMGALKFLQGQQKRWERHRMSMTNRTATNSKHWLCKIGFHKWVGLHDEQCARCRKLRGVKEIMIR